jgi:hypothetical protein
VWLCGFPNGSKLGESLNAQFHEWNFFLRRCRSPFPFIVGKASAVKWSKLSE